MTIATFGRVRQALPGGAPIGSGTRSKGEESGPDVPPFDGSLYVGGQFGPIWRLQTDSSRLDNPMVFIGGGLAWPTWGARGNELMVPLRRSNLLDPLFGEEGIWRLPYASGEVDVREIVDNRPYFSAGEAFLSILRPDGTLRGDSSIGRVWNGTWSDDFRVVARTEITSIPGLCDWGGPHTLAPWGDHHHWMDPVHVVQVRQIDVDGFPRVFDPDLLETVTPRFLDVRADVVLISGLSNSGSFECVWTGRSPATVIGAAVTGERDAGLRWRPVGTDPGGISGANGPVAISNTGDGIRFVKATDYRRPGTTGIRSGLVEFGTDGFISKATDFDELWPSGLTPNLTVQWMSGG